MAAKVAGCTRIAGMARSYKSCCIQQVTGIRPFFGGAGGWRRGISLAPKKQKAPKPFGFGALDSAIWSGRWESNPQL
jgi:hypothetical protein